MVCLDFQANSNAADGLQLAVASLPSTANPSVPMILSALFNGGSFECQFCLQEFNTNREFTAGSIDLTPIPAALPLFATGLGGLGLLAFRRKRKAQAVA